jgi:hypothetical protein
MEVAMSECSFTALADLHRDLDWAEHQEELARTKYKEAQAMTRTLRWQIHCLTETYREMNIVAA